MTSTRLPAVPTLGGVPDKAVIDAGKTVSLIKFPNKTIGPQFTAKIIAWFELYHHKYGRYPAVDEIMGHFKWTPDQIMLLNCHPFWLKCLERRGLSLPVANGLTPTQVATISVICNFTDRRSIPAKIAALGVSEEQLNGWYANHEFQREMQIRTEAVLEHSFPEIQSSLIKQAQKGNMAAVKFYYEVTGRVQTPEQVNVRLAVSKLIEAVQKHVNDPEILQAIAAEVQASGVL